MVTVTSYVIQEPVHLAISPSQLSAIVDRAGNMSLATLLAGLFSSATRFAAKHSTVGSTSARSNAIKETVSLAT